MAQKLSSVLFYSSVFAFLFAYLFGSPFYAEGQVQRLKKVLPRVLYECTPQEMAYMRPCFPNGTECSLGSCSFKAYPGINQTESEVGWCVCKCLYNSDEWDWDNSKYLAILRGQSRASSTSTQQNY